MIPFAISALAKAHLRSASANSEYRAVISGVRWPKARISAVVGLPASGGDSGHRRGDPEVVAQPVWLDGAERRREARLVRSR
jgi:hypothetical protein